MLENYFKLKEHGTIEVIQDVSSELLERWSSTLRPWNFGKRSTGRAVESLLEERGGSELISDSGNLVPEAYDLLASRLD